MEELKESISLRCTFCRSEAFALPYKGYSPPHGSFIVCANCGRENDITSLIRVVKAKAVNMTKGHVKNFVADFKKDLKRVFKDSKRIKIK